MPRPRILAIDDTPANLRALGAGLSHEFDLQIATSGTQGLALAHQSAPDLILLDVMMPFVDGYQVYRQIKANVKLQAIPVIFVTALKDYDAELRGLQLGAADYLTKPINAQIARQRIRNLLEREQLRKEVEAHRDHLEQLVAERTAEVRSLGMALLAAEARERRAIDVVLHSDLGQNLVVAKLKLGAMALPDDGADANVHADHCRRCRLQVEEVEKLIDRSNQSVHSLSTELSPPVLSPLGFGPALQWLAEEMERSYGLGVSVDLCKMAPLDETTSNTLYRIVRELLINTWKHADVSCASVTVEKDAASGKLKVSVADDGAGFDATQALKPSPRSCHGLFAIKQRIDFMGGTMCIDSKAGSGTVVTVALASAPA